MVATNIHWTEAPFDMGGWQFYESEEALRDFLKDYEVEITGTGPLLELYGREGRIYGFKARLKT